METEETTPAARSESDELQAEAARAARSESDELQAEAAPAAPSESDEPQAEASELVAARALADERYEELQYARAEIDNVRKRALRIAEERLTHARKALIGKFLPVLDNLERALKYDDSQDLRGGLQATLKGFEAVLAGEQVVPVETVGKPFDPHVAEAITTRESDEPDDTVLEEVQRGFRLGEELLRPAMVVVAKRADADAKIE